MLCANGLSEDYYFLVFLWLGSWIRFFPGSVALRSGQVTCRFFTMLPDYVSNPKIL